MKQHVLPNLDNYPDTSFLRPKTVAMLLGISIASFWRLCAAGKIKTYKLTERTTSVRVGELRAFIASQGGA